jgi:hypothetical protein
LRTIALRRFAKGPNIFLSPRNSYVFRPPQGEGINGSRRPMAARTAMTIAHADGLPGHGELDGPTETTSIVALTGSFDIGATPGTALVLGLPKSLRHLIQSFRSRKNDFSVMK